jgi:hypothetical protein
MNLAAEQQTPASFKQPEPASYPLKGKVSHFTNSEQVLADKIDKLTELLTITHNKYKMLEERVLVLERGLVRVEPD